MAGDDAKYRLSDEVLDRSIGEDLLVHRFDNDEVWVFNAHARIVFEAVKAGGTCEDIRRFVADKGFGEPQELEAVDRTLAQMLEQGLAVLEGEPSPEAPR